MEWVEFRISVQTGLVEAVANLIHESGAGGVVIEHENNQKSTVTAYIPAGDESKTIAGKLDDFWIHLDRLGIETNAKVNTSLVSERDWAEEWKKHYYPVRIGSVLITPSWLTPERGNAEIVVELDPGMAFGTGTHATTQMCISELKIASPRGKTMLDLGSGSGILSIVAAKLGSVRVDAVDNDRVAIEVAQENALRNSCTINFAQGDAFEIFASSSHDLVVANIGFSASEKLAEIHQRTGKKCTLILSGFPVERLSDFAGIAVARFHSQEGWGCMVLEGE